MSSKFKFIDLFAGIGGIRRPFSNMGGECVFSSEIDKFAVQTYEANWGETPSGDITKIDAKDIPDFDILLAGFPCQPFSISGKRLGFTDTRGTLFFDIARIIKEKQPAAFLLENVKGLVNHDKGNTFRTIKSVIENDLGYKLYYKVLNAKDFGVPQNRERIILVGFKDHNVVFDFPEPTGEPTRLGDILEPVVDSKYTLSDTLWNYMINRKAEQQAKGNGFGYSLFNEDSPYTSTISARYYKDGSEILVEQKGKNPRRLTPRECARLQGFDDSFKLVCSDNQCYKQFGNSVPTKMIEAVAKQMLAALKLIPQTLHIAETTYDNNLLFYTMMKNLVKLRLSQRKLIIIQDVINEKCQKYNNNVGDFKKLLMNSDFTTEKTKDDLFLLLNTLSDDNLNMWVHMMDCAIDLILFKDLILAESKAFATQMTQKVEKEIKDKLSLQYDISCLELPYGQRVISTLLVSGLLELERETACILEVSNETVKSISEKLKKLIPYNINCANMLMLIVNESMNQSIKSTAGASYEDRVSITLAGNVDNIQGHCHDANIPAMEYDNKFSYKGKVFGVSAKRTLRERYKQNHEDVDELEVDYVLAITLGIDLNEEKVKNILQKNGNYIIVANEVYKESPYMQENEKVFSSENDIKKVLDKIIDYH